MFAYCSPQPALHQVTSSGQSYRLLGHHQTNPGGIARILPVLKTNEMPLSAALPASHHQTIFSGFHQTVYFGQQNLDRELLPAATTTRGNHGAPGAGSHAVAETMLLSTATVMWLVGTLSHFHSCIKYNPENFPEPQVGHKTDPNCSE
ncbi:Uncharacterised protein [Mobiluncus mulieris]|uniref:Uncharacterized protein n=1 Tax=Mobiluncus mulieris TaxID=2052 RepID=A0A8G2M5C3_9ACTO|nr:Uncharacterised protein [Mobiluncus mulieris]